MGQCNTNATLLAVYNAKQANNIADMQSADATRYTMALHSTPLYAYVWCLWDLQTWHAIGAGQASLLHRLMCLCAVHTALILY